MHLARAHGEVEAAFLAGFLYCLAWRFAFPDIDASSERLADLAMVSAYVVRLLPRSRFTPIGFDPRRDGRSTHRFLSAAAALWELRRALRTEPDGSTGKLPCRAL